jgi:hypothetical protein
MAFVIAGARNGEMELLQGKTTASLDRCSEGFNPLRLVQIPVIRQARCGRDGIGIPNSQDWRLDVFVLGLLGVVKDRLAGGRRAVGQAPGHCRHGRLAGQRRQ